MAQFFSATVSGFLPDVLPVLGKICHDYTFAAHHLIDFLKDAPDGHFLLGFVTSLTKTWFLRPLDPPFNLG